MISNVYDALEAIASRWPPTHGQTFVLQYELSDPREGDIDRLFVTFTEGEARATAGTAARADATLALSATDFLAKANGTADVDQLFMSGKMKVSGNAIFVRNLRMARR